MESENNSQKNMGITFGIIILLGVLSATIFLGKQSAVPAISQTTPDNFLTPSNTSQNSPPNTPTVIKTTPEYTLAQVATHSNSSSCWSVVRNRVYDLTSWINSHPGGTKAILSMCGKDATTAFEKQHGGQRRPEQELKSFFIGNYKK